MAGDCMKTALIAAAALAAGLLIGTTWAVVVDYFNDYPDQAAGR